MKKTIRLLALILCLAFGMNAQAQNLSLFESQKQTNETKPIYTHLIIYREWKQGIESHGDYANIIYQWQTQDVLFKSFDEMKKWLNSSRWYGGGDADRKVAISESELIAIYDLTTAKEIKVKLYTEKKSKPTQVIIEKEEWMEQHYEIIK